MSDELPWPSMRANDHGTGCRGDLESSFATNSTGQLRSLPTHSSIVATPVVGPSDQIYVGALDGKFYAWQPRDDTILWKFPSDGFDAVDGAAYIAKSGTLFVSSVGGCLYSIAADGSQIWKWDNVTPSQRQTYSPSTIYWFEANVIQGPTGLVYAGCDDFYLYAVEPEHGNLRWAFPTGFNVWSVPAFGSSGALYFGSFDTRFMHLMRSRERIAGR